MSYKLVVVLALLCQTGVHCKSINSFAGPFIIYHERFYMCELENRTLEWTWSVRTTHFNPYKPKEIQLLTGNVTGNVSVDDNCWGKIILDIWQNNQWKENALILSTRDRACTQFKTNLPGFYEHLFKKRETKGPCILKPGVYELHNAPVNTALTNFPIMPYGRYRIQVTGGRTESYTCLRAVLRIIPRTD